MDKVPDYEIRVCEFTHLLHSYIHYKTNTLLKGMNTLIPLTMGEIVLLLFQELLLNTK